MMGYCTLAITFDRISHVIPGIIITSQKDEKSWNDGLPSSPFWLQASCFRLKTLRSHFRLHLTSDFTLQNSDFRLSPYDRRSLKIDVRTVNLSKHEVLSPKSPLGFRTYFHQKSKQRPKASNNHNYQLFNYRSRNNIGFTVRSEFPWTNTDVPWRTIPLHQILWLLDERVFLQTTWTVRSIYWKWWCLNGRGASTGNRQQMQVCKMRNLLYH